MAYRLFRYGKPMSTSENDMFYGGYDPADAVKAVEFLNENLPQDLVRPNHCDFTFYNWFRNSCFCYINVNIQTINPKYRNMQVDPLRDSFDEEKLKKLIVSCSKRTNCAESLLDLDGEDAILTDVSSLEMFRAGDYQSVILTYALNEIATQIIRPGAKGEDIITDEEAYKCILYQALAFHFLGETPDLENRDSMMYYTALKLTKKHPRTKTSPDYFLIEVDNYLRSKDDPEDLLREILPNNEDFEQFKFIYDQIAKSSTVG